MFNKKLKQDLAIAKERALTFEKEWTETIAAKEKLKDELEALKNQGLPRVQFTVINPACRPTTVIGTHAKIHWGSALYIYDGSTQVGTFREWAGFTRAEVKKDG